MPCCLQGAENLTQVVAALVEGRDLGEREEKSLYIVRWVKCRHLKTTDLGASRKESQRPVSSELRCLS